MIERKKYDKSFFDELESNSYLSAKKVIPLVNDIIKPESIIDVGCGTGEWLNVWQNDFGKKDIKGIEGDYVKKEMFKIDPSKIDVHDLKLPYQAYRKYDLAMSLEVGEHLPTESSEQFVKTLVGLSDVILFSAALPAQGGTYHINEQYPEFWAAIFKKYNYLPVDYLREKIWNIDGIEYWYKQNIMIYIAANKINDYGILFENSKTVNPDYLFRIHPDLYNFKIRKLNQTSSLYGFLKWKWVEFKYKHLKK